MPLWIVLFNAIEAFSLPLIGVIVLCLSKLTSGPSARIAERWFLGVLFAVTVITCRTVIFQDDCWFVHTGTLAFMTVGALLLPGRESLGQRRVAHTSH